MAINLQYDENKVGKAVADAIHNYYTILIEKLDGLKLSTVLRRKNPYLFRAKAVNGASQLVDAVLSAFVSSSEETIFGDVFFEPIALIAVQGQKALAKGVDIMVERENTIYAIAVKSGTSVFNGDSRQTQEKNFIAAFKLAQQAHKSFTPIVGYGYGRKRATSRGQPKMYLQLAGQVFWEELTGDNEFYLKLIRYMEQLPETYIEGFNAAYQKAANRLVREFTIEFCYDDGSIHWEKLVKYNSGI
jgi:hypothetical protein